jgi:hypothetical protein
MNPKFLVIVVAGAACMACTGRADSPSDSLVAASDSAAPRFSIDSIRYFMKALDDLPGEYLPVQVASDEEVSEKTATFGARRVVARLREYFGDCAHSTAALTIDEMVVLYAYHRSCGEVGNSVADTIFLSNDKVISAKVEGTDTSSAITEAYALFGKTRGK